MTVKEEALKKVGLNHETTLLNQQSVEGACGVDLPDAEGLALRIGGAPRKEIGLPQLSEPQVMRHYVRLSRQNYAIDTGFYPLGSCTMKHNPRINEKLARLSGFANIHPLQEESTVQGALELMYELQNWLAELSGLHAVSLAPAAGAHGEFAGMSAIKKAHEVSGDTHKNIVLIPDSAHGTNPATAAICGYKIEVIPSGKDTGVIDIEDVRKAVEKHGDNIAGVMITNPNTCGKFEPQIKEIADLIHSVGGYFYCDGANFNAIMGKVKPADFGVDVMHFNLHKTFSTPHCGGGPGCGPIAVCEKLADCLPDPHVTKNSDSSYSFEKPKHSIGKIKGFHGHFGMMVRALTYMMSHGRDGLERAAKDAVLSANYVLTKLRGHYHVPFEGYCMHECLLSDKLQKGNGVTTLDIAKALVECGIHPMTVFFPLVVSNAMLIEPTESESKNAVDEFVDVMIVIANKVKKKDTGDILQSPTVTPRKRLDEVAAAKNPVLTWDEV